MNSLTAKKFSNLVAASCAIVMGFAAVGNCNERTNSDPIQIAETTDTAKSSGKDNPIKIGYVVPLSGASEGAGKQIVNGMQLYLDQIQHKMAGRPVDVIVENDGTNPASAVEKVHKLVKQDNVSMISGVYMTNALYAMAPVVESYHLPFIVVSSGAADVTQRKRQKWLVRPGYTSTALGFVMGNYAFKKANFRKVACVGADYGFGWEGVGSFQQEFERLGGKVVKKLWAPLGLTDFTEILKQIPPDVDAVFEVTVGQQVDVIHKNYHALGFKAPVIGMANTFDSWILPHMGEEVVGGKCSTLYTPTLNTAANKAFVKAFKAKYNQEPSYVSEFGYTSMMFIDKAVQGLKGNVEDKEALLAALKKVEIKDAPRGPLKMDAYNQSINNVYITRVDRVGGGLQNTVIDTYPMVSQFWTFKPEELIANPSYSREYPPCPNCIK
jgi:branched-chain amino acid transport system substrate-binding protein